MTLSNITNHKFTRAALWIAVNGLMYYILQAWVRHNATWAHWLFIIMYWLAIAANSLLCIVAHLEDTRISKDTTESIKKGPSVPLPISVLYDWLLIYILVTTGHNLLAIGWAWQTACQIDTYKNKSICNRSTAA